MNEKGFPKRPVRGSIRAPLGFKPPIRRPLIRPMPMNQPQRNPRLPYVSPQQPLTPKRSNLKTWLILGFVFLIIVIIVVILLLSSNTSIIPENDLDKGVSLYLKEGDSERFEIDNEAHKISVSKIRSESVSITVESEKIEFTLRVDEVKKIDFNGDGFFDFRVRLKNIRVDQITLVVKKISENSCQEDWDCNDWGECIGGLRFRTCEDLNSCVTNDGRPEEEEECVIDGSDNQVPINCGTNWECFIVASENCTKANMTKVSSIDFFGLIITSEYLREIKGFRDNKCIYYQRLINSSYEFNDTLVEIYKAANKSDEEIALEEQMINDEYKKSIGLEDTCSFPPEDLKGLLQKWQQGSFSGGASCTLSFDPNEQECNYTGDFSNGSCERSCYRGAYCETLADHCFSYGLGVSVGITIGNKFIEIVSINSTSNSVIVEVEGTSDTIDYEQVKTINNVKIKNLGIENELARLEINCNNY